MQKLLQEMVETYGNQVYRLALRYTGNMHQAQDITQETFLRVYKHLDRFDSSKPVGPWVFKIAGNICRNWLRDNREVPVALTDNLIQSTNPGPEEIYLEKEGEREVMHALYNMPLIYREVLLLRHVGELSYTEICDALSLELSQVKNRLYRGRIMLKEVLQKGE